MADFTIYIGNKNYSSWSLRGWLMLKQSGASFEEVVIPLRETGTRTTILRHSPSGRVPALERGELVIWESLAIGEYLAERFPEAGLWPADQTARAVARAVSAEMHAGFSALRSHLPMNIRSTFAGRSVTPEAQADINRITALWRDCRKRFGQEGQFLFGQPTIADAMYAPVCTRFRTYCVALPPEAEAYCQHIMSLPPMQEWIEAAKAEPEEVPELDAEF
jgi:glutathione S-transferase